MSNEQIKFNDQKEELVSKVDSAFSHQKTLAAMLERAKMEGDTAKISEISQLIRLNDEKIKELDRLYRVAPSNENLSSINKPGVIANENLHDYFGSREVGEEERRRNRG